MGPVAKKIAFLRDHLRARSGHLSPLEIEQVASILDSFVPLVDTLEERPVPPRLRVVESAPKPPSAA